MSVVEFFRVWGDWYAGVSIIIFTLVAVRAWWWAVPKIGVLLQREPRRGDPYRESTYVSKVGRNLPLHYVREWSQNETCPKCGDPVVRPHNSGRLCTGVVGKCPVDREHFHWYCRCDHTWIGATKDRPENGESA